MNTGRVFYYLRQSAVFMCCAALIFMIGCGEKTAEPQTGYADYNDMLVYYDDKGGTGPVLLFVHGWNCDMSFWREQVPAFSDEYRVVLMDLPGYGQSGKPEIEYTQPFFAGAVAAVLDTVDADKAVLLGHSMGFSVCRLFAKEHPERVQALIAVDGALPGVEGEPPAPEEMEQWFADFLKRLDGPEYTQAVTEFVNMLHAPETSEGVKEEVVSKMTSAPQHVAVSAMQNFEGGEASKAFQVEVPTLAIVAEADYITEEYEDFMRTLFPNLEYATMSGVGHFLMLEKPDAVNGVIRNYLNSL